MKTDIVDEEAVRTHFRTCPLCEATCGLEITTRADRVVRIRGDRDDVFSKGFICPKGSTIKDLDADPDRVRRPMVRTGDEWREVTWAEAFAAIEARLADVRARHGLDAVGLYLGNPNVHHLSGLLYNSKLIKALRTKHLYSASTADQVPKQVSAGLMFGTPLSVPVADIDRTDYLLMLGADPYESNGSLMTAPDFPARIEAMRARGGRLVVVDPRRSKTAEHADRHVPIRPGTDAWFLLSLLHVVFAQGRWSLGRAGPWVAGLEDVQALAGRYAPEETASITRVPPETTRRIASELCDAPTAAVYGRMGTCTQEFGTIASWLVDVLNVVTGNLDRAGGAMFTTPAAGNATTHGAPGVGRGIKLGRWKSRVRAMPEVFGELPVATLVDEIDTPGDGRIRALFTVAGNPALSTPDSDRADAALASLELMVSVDVYLNETTRHAHVLLPAQRVLTRSHYDMSLYQLAVRNVAHWSAPVFALDPDEMPEWEILLRLAAIASGLGADADVAALDDAMARAAVESAVQAPGGPVEGRDVGELLAMVDKRRGPDRLLDIRLRCGPYGDAFGANPGGLSLDELVARPHGVDLGALVPRLPDVLRTPSGCIELAPAPLVADVARLDAAAASRRADVSLLLVGRRHLRSNNSWMHNVSVLVKGKDRCTLHVHPDDAARLGLEDGATARVRSSAGEVLAPVEVTDAVAQGVVSMPHGWGHDRSGARLSVASARAGVNMNVLVPRDRVDVPSGNAILSGIAVEVSRA